MSLSGIWTSKGIDKLAAQTAGGPTLTIDKIALGDGGGIVPAVLPSQAALLKEVWRGLVNAVLIEPDTPNAVTVEAVIPYSIGGFYIREWGIYDTDGDLIAVGPHAEFYKPLLAEGSGAELLERIQLPLANAGQINLTISSEALATRKYVDQTATAKAREEVTRHDGDEEAHDGRIDALVKRKLNTTAPLTGGGDFSKDITLKINASVAATANYVIQRDASGRAQVAAPAVAEDIARKADVDAVEGRIPTAWPLMIVTWGATANYNRKTLVIGSNGKIYVWLKASGPAITGAGAKDPTVAANATYWLDYAASIIIKSNYEYSRIGTPHYLPSSVLPTDYMWADGSLALFADYPDFKKKYDAKGFEGMVLPANATQATKDANLGKFVLNAKSTGLYLPRHGGQFMRGWTPAEGGQAGAWGRDEMRNFLARFNMNYTGRIGNYTAFAARYTNVGSGPDAQSSAAGYVTIDPSTVVPTGPENVPAHIWQPVAIYMGAHA